MITEESYDSSITINGVSIGMDDCPCLVRSDGSVEMFEIVKEVYPFVMRSADGATLRWPFKLMKPGDAVFLLYDSKAQRSAHSYAKANGWKIRTETLLRLPNYTTRLIVDRIA